MERNFDEGKVWKVSQSIFPSDNDDDENKRKVDEKFIVNGGACWGLMWVWFPVWCLDMKCLVSSADNSLDSFKNFRRMSPTTDSLPRAARKHSPRTSPDDENVSIAKQKICFKLLGGYSKAKSLEILAKSFFPDLFFVFNCEEKISISFPERMKLPALETWIITTLRALFTYLLAV